MLTIVLSLEHSMYISLTYFIIIKKTDSFVLSHCSTADEDRLDGTGSIDYNGSTDRSSTSPLHDSSIQGEGRLERRKGDHGDENLPLSSEDMPDHYIYVSYPPELKRRLLER